MLGDTTGLHPINNSWEADTERSAVFNADSVRKTLHPLCIPPSVLPLTLSCRVGTRPEQNTEIVIGETDYNSYAVIYYQKRGKMTVKLYGGASHTCIPINTLEQQQQCFSFDSMFCV